MGFKDGADTATIGDPSVWKWKHIFSTVWQMYYCKFTPEKVASVGNTRMIATIEGSPNGYAGAGLWLPNVTPSAAQLVLPQFQITTRPVETDFQKCLFTSYMYHIGTDLHWWISHCLPDTKKALTRLIIDCATDGIYIKSFERSALTSVFSPYAN